MGSHFCLCMACLWCWFGLCIGFALSVSVFHCMMCHGVFSQESFTVFTTLDLSHFVCLWCLLWFWGRRGDFSRVGSSLSLPVGSNLPLDHFLHLHFLEEVQVAAVFQNIFSFDGTEACLYGDSCYSVFCPQSHDFCCLSLGLPVAFSRETCLRRVLVAWHCLPLPCWFMCGMTSRIMGLKEFNPSQCTLFHGHHATGQRCQVCFHQTV